MKEAAHHKDAGLDPVSGQILHILWRTTVKAYPYYHVNRPSDSCNCCIEFSLHSPHWKAVAWTWSTPMLTLPRFFWTALQKECKSIFLSTVHGVSPIPNTLEVMQFYSFSKISLLSELAFKLFMSLRFFICTNNAGFYSDFNFVSLISIIFFVF